ncbi:Ig-like domain-containing protein [Luteolibacter arcticus]|uniref:Ig-like domain-containing protein n=1 Tax=Luteolibacter arcticus TaxID=1581411 RepID=A0ABT3GQB0_9BACT|nr:Ig-like domain-containing protein [Luteolibacter arcticus]MCW1925672.1 Ig-like domain-containing protein [Luteolibacter arcticus]
MRPSHNLIATLLGLSLTTVHAVDFSGSYSQNFDSMGTSGTAAPAGWTFYGGMGGSNSTWGSSIPAADAGLGTANATLTASTSTSTSSNTAGYNYASSSSTADRCLGSSPTSGRGVAWQLSLTNTGTSAIGEIELGYLTRRFTAPSDANELPGHRVFYSLNNGSTWTNVAALNPVISGTTGVVVPTMVGVTTVPATSITFSSGWTPGSVLLLRWADDNAAQSSPDQIIGLDNVIIAAVAGNTLPEVALTAPSTGASYDAPATIALTATASDTDGTISKVEFYNGATKLGEDTTEPYELVLSNVISGSYSLAAKAIDNVSGAITSAAASVTVTNVDNVLPTVAITSPVDTSTRISGGFTIEASASDTDGAVSKVEFYDGATKLGEDTSAPFVFAWASPAIGSHTLTAVATDNDSGTTTSTAVDIEVVQALSATVIAKESVWNYLDNGSDQGTAWKEPAFNDSAWASGKGVLGGGDGHIDTIINIGPSGNRYITTYFRRTFELTGAAAVQALDFNILRDDGVVVFINGVEVARQNLPAGPINYLTDTPAIIDGSAESTYFPATASPLPPLVEGTNVIAVEVHQRDGNSSDLGFDLEMITRALPGEAPEVTLTSPADDATYQAPASVTLIADATDSDGTIAKVEFFAGATKIGEDTEAPFAFEWTMVPQGSYTLTAKATDNLGLGKTSEAADIVVTAPATAAPAVSITAPANEASYMAPAVIEITATAEDSDGTIAKVEFFNGVTKLGEDDSEPYSFSWTGVQQGDYTLTAKATDNMTATAISTAITVHVVPNQPPLIAPLAPVDLAEVPAPAATLQVLLDDPEDLPLTVTFYGRPKSPTPGADFTVITLPDTQFYSENNNNRFSQFLSQTNWIVSSKTTLNTAFVAHMGDMVQNGDSVDAEWQRADQAMDIIEDPATTLLTHGIPWGGAPGNHDGGGSKWNQYFGSARWAGRPYFQGNFGGSNVNNYQFFSASGMDFIVINLAYNSNTNGNQAVMDWADALLKAYPQRRAIVTSHWLIDLGNQAPWGGHGQAVYDNLKDNPNLFLMLCGHIHGEGRRQDTFQGRTVHTILQDYQSRSGYPGGLGGGDGWLRYYVFSPATNTITAKTYRTTSGAYETDADSEFTFAYNMQAPAPWTQLGTVEVPAGGSAAQVEWTGLATGTDYEWYVSVTDGVTPVGSTIRSFSAVTPPAVTVSITATDARAGESGADQELALTITRSGSTTAALNVPLLSSGTATAGSDYTGFTASVTIPANESSVVLPLTAVADAEAEGEETVIITLGSSPDFTAGSPASSNAIIADRPAQGFYHQNIPDPGKRAPGEDADADGVANVIEYFMGTLPGDGGSRGTLEVQAPGSGTIKIRYPRALNRTDVTAALEWSAALDGTWHASGESEDDVTVAFSEAVVSGPEADPETVEATATITGSAVKVFVRLRAD